MDDSATTTIESEPESKRLRLGELIQLSDELSHRQRQLSTDGRKVLDDVLTGLDELSMAERLSSDSSTDADRRAFRAVRRELQSSWLRVDSMVDDLLSSAADEISEFVTFAESQIGAYERAIRHREAGNCWRDNLEAEELRINPGLHSNSGGRTGDR